MNHHTYLETRVALNRMQRALHEMQAGFALALEALRTDADNENPPAG